MIINKPMIIDLNKVPIKCQPKQQQQQIVVVDLHHRTCRESNSIDMQTTENVIRTIGDAVVLHYYYTYDDDDERLQMNMKKREE